MPETHETTLRAVAEATARVVALEDELRGALEDRDDVVRAALVEGVAYRALGEVTGLSRGRLDQIRRGRRSGRE